MKLTLFILSILGFTVGAYFLISELAKIYTDSTLFGYILLLIILVCTSIIGLIIVVPRLFFKKSLVVKY